MLDSLRDILRRPPLCMDEDIFWKHAPNLRAGIIVAAANLKQEMDCTTSEYSILDPRDRLSLQAQLQESKLMDIASWRIVNQSQSVSGVFLCLFPGVYKKALKGGELSLLVKPVLITLHQKSANSLQAFQSQGALTRPKQRAKSEPNNKPHRSDEKAGEESLRCPRRGKHTERAGASSFPWGNFLGKRSKTITGRQSEQSSRSNLRSNIDLPSDSILKGKTK